MSLGSLLPGTPCLVHPCHPCFQGRTRPPRWPCASRLFQSRVGGGRAAGALRRPEQAPRPLLAAVCDLCFCCSGAWGGACRLWAVLLAVWGNLSLVLLLGVFVCRPARLLVHVTCLPPPVQEPPSLGSWSRVQDAGGSLSWLQVQGQPLSSGPLPSPTRSSTFLSRGLVLVRATWARHPQETPWRVGRAAALSLLG